jgi:ribosomal protein S18 acetylase RimI-like enzyme
MEYRVRQLNEKDESIVWTMLRYAAGEESIESTRANSLLARYAVGWGRDGDTGCVAESQEVAMGAAWLRLWQGDDRGFGYVSGDIPELGLAVLPEYRHGGIGTQLLQGVLQIAKNSFPAVSLSVRSDNPVLSLYRRVGFIPVEGTAVVNRTGGRSFTMLYEFS